MRDLLHEDWTCDNCSGNNPGASNRCIHCLAPRRKWKVTISSEAVAKYAGETSTGVNFSQTKVRAGADIVIMNRVTIRSSELNFSGQFYSSDGNPYSVAFSDGHFDRQRWVDGKVILLRGKKVLWVKDVSRPNDAKVALNGTVVVNVWGYIPDHRLEGTLLVFDPRGNILLSQKFDSNLYDCNITRDAKICFVNTLAPDNTVYALETASGNLLWAFKDKLALTGKIKVDDDRQVVEIIGRSGLGVIRTLNFSGQSVATETEESLKARVAGVRYPRDRPAYRDVDRPPYNNPNIERWWTAEHDELMKRLIDQWQWGWYWKVTEAVVSMTPKDTLDSFREQEKGQLGSWYNKIMCFAITRAKSLGLTGRIRAPQWKTCPLCGEKFVEDSLPASFAERFGMDHLDFCAPCLKNTIFGGNDASSREQVLEYIRDLTDVLQLIPHQSFGELSEDYHDMTFEQKLAVLKVLQKKPTLPRVRELFGSADGRDSWFRALIEAGVLDKDARRTDRGTQCLARDGHVCYSFGEKTIDDFLHARDITHDKEPNYPVGNYRADFAVSNIFIEYFGLKGDPDYDEKIQEKQRICKEHNVDLIELYSSDLTNIAKLERKLSIVLSGTRTRKLM